MVTHLYVLLSKLQFLAQDAIIGNVLEVFAFQEVFPLNTLERHANLLHDAA